MFADDGLAAELLGSVALFFHGDCEVVGRTPIGDFGRRINVAVEVMTDGAALWTVRDGKVARVVCYPDRAEALTAVDVDG